MTAIILTFPTPSDLESQYQIARRDYIWADGLWRFNPSAENEIRRAKALARQQQLFSLMQYHAV